MAVRLCDSGRTWAPGPGENLLGTSHREHSNQQPEKEKGLFVILLQSPSSEIGFLRLDRLMT